MDLLNSELATVAITSVKEHPRNPNRGNVDSIRESIRENGFFGAVVAQRSTGYVLAGNHRLRAAIAEGAQTVPVAWVDCDDRRALKILLADNRLAEFGARDADALASLLSDLADAGAGELLGTGYTAADLGEILTHAAVPDFAPEEVVARLDEVSKTRTCPECGHAW